MNNLLKLTIVSASILAASASHATDTQLVGAVAPVCEALSPSTPLLDFGMNPSAGATVNNNVQIRCNDADGANVELRSSEGGLESDDNEDFSVEYTATLIEGTSGINLSLTTSPGVGQNDESVDQDVSGGIALASGVTAALEVTLNDTPFWSGGYSDTLAVDVTGN